MNNITEKAIKVITYLKEQDIHNTVDGPIYIPKEYITTLENLLIAHQHQTTIIKSLKEYFDFISEKLKQEIMELENEK